MSIGRVISSISATGISPSAKLVMIILANHENSTTGLCCPGLQTIAEETGLARSTVQTAISELVSKGLIEKTTVKGRWVSFTFPDTGDIEGCHDARSGGGGDLHPADEVSQTVPMTGIPIVGTHPTDYRYGYTDNRYLTSKLTGKPTDSVYDGFPPSGSGSVYRSVGGEPSDSVAERERMIDAASGSMRNAINWWIEPSDSIRYSQYDTATILFGALGPGAWRKALRILGPEGDSALRELFIVFRAEIRVNERPRNAAAAFTARIKKDLGVDFSAVPEGGP